MYCPLYAASLPRSAKGWINVLDELRAWLTEHLPELALLFIAVVGAALIGRREGRY